MHENDPDFQGSQRRRGDDAASSREHKRRRFRRRRRKAYIRSIYSLPSLATLGNAVCGFGAIWVAALIPLTAGNDQWTQFFARERFTVAAYLIFLAMIFDALDGRLARFARHTTDFGGQLDSLADVISFGAAPAFLAMQLCRTELLEMPVFMSRLIWAIGALYMSCAAIRLARFNVSNEHGEQHHFSFLGLPSPGAGGTVAAFVLMHQELLDSSHRFAWLATLADLLVWLAPVVVLLTGLLMVSNIRYPHLVNRYLRGKRSLGRVLAVLVIFLLIVVAHEVVLAVGTLAYALYGLVNWLYFRARPKSPLIVPPPSA